VVATISLSLAQSAFGQGREPVPPEIQEPQKPPSVDEPRWKVGGEQDLADLLGAASAILGIPIEFDRAAVAGPLALRLTGPLRDEELLDLVHRNLVAKNLTTVQMPGSRGLTVVTLDKAPSLARLEEKGLRGARAGFVKVLLEIEHDRVDGATEAIKLVLSKSGTVTSFKDTRTLLISDLKPNVTEALDVARRIDGPFTNIDVFEIKLQHTSPAALVALLERISQTKKAVLGEKQSGTVLAHPDGGSVLVVAPALERDMWEDLVRRFDRADPVQTVNYSPRRFGVKETSKLILETLGPPTSGEGWRLVTDELTGTLVITATPSQHRVVQELFDRLEGSERGPRHPMRSFPIRHRGVEELRDLLVSMLEKGALKDLPDVKLAPTGQVVDRVPPADEKVQGVTAPIPNAKPPRSDSTSSLGDELVLTADKATNRLIALGSPRVLEQLEHLISELDVREPQVMVEALVLALTEGDTLSLGVELQRIGTSGTAQYKLGSLFGLGSTSPTEPTLPALQGTGGVGAVLDPGTFSVLVKALETLNQGRALTIPKVLVTNLQTADLNSVLQTPFASVNASTTVATTSFGGTQDAGTQISVTPRITQGDELALDYTITLSSFVGDASNPALPPPRQENKLKSSATVPDGFTVAVGGLEIETEGTSNERVPVLGWIPILGSLFSSQSHTKTKARFFVFLRTSVLRNQQFEDLRYLGEKELAAAKVSDSWPRVEPRIIR
jgi:type II secretory pathway component GspD/PulD (secretin)